MKSPDTASKICAQWDRFTSGVGFDLVDKYYDIPEEYKDETKEEKKEDKTSRHIFNGLI